MEFSGNDVLYSSFYEFLIEKGKFKKLRDILSPRTKQQDELYVKCLDYLKEKIHIIVLYDHEEENRNTFLYFIDKLDRFPKLDFIEIHTTTSDMVYQNLAKYVNPVIESNMIPLLQQLLIKSAVDDTVFFNLSTKKQRSLLPLIDLNSLEVDIYNKRCSTVNEELMLLIMNQCPNLNSCTLKNSGKTYLCYNETATLLQFIVYFLKMPIFFFLENNVMPLKTAGKFIENSCIAIKKESNPFELRRSLY